MRWSSGNSARPAMSGTHRHSQLGTSFSSNFFNNLGTPALRKYFCARTSQATCDQPAGTSMSSRRKTTEPSGFLISLKALRNSMFEYGESFSFVNSRWIRIAPPTKRSRVVSFVWTLRPPRCDLVAVYFRLCTSPRCRVCPSATLLCVNQHLLVCNRKIPNVVGILK